MIRTILIFLFLCFSSVSYADKLIELTWDFPTQRQDGSTLKHEEIDRFNLYQTVNGVVQGVREIEPNLQRFEVLATTPGIYQFAISTVSEGLEGLPSKPVSVVIDQSPPARIELTIKFLQ